MNPDCFHEAALSHTNITEVRQSDLSLQPCSGTVASANSWQVARNAGSQAVPQGLLNQKMKTLIIQLCPILCNSMDCSPPGSFVHGIFQARILEWVAFPSPGDRRSSQLRDWTHVSSIAGRFFTISQNLHFNQILRKFVLTLTFEKSETVQRSRGRRNYSDWCD